MDNPFLYFIVGIVAFLIGVLITRWIFGIDKIIDSLQRQNDYTMVQVRLLKKMLLNQGTSSEEIDEIIDNGNKKKEENEVNIIDPISKIEYEKFKKYENNKQK